jgi:hypothetical protein
MRPSRGRAGFKQARTRLDMAKPPHRGQPRGARPIVSTGRSRRQSARSRRHVSGSRVRASRSKGQSLRTGWTRQSRWSPRRARRAHSLLTSDGRSPLACRARIDPTCAAVWTSLVPRPGFEPGCPFGRPILSRGETVRMSPSCTAIRAQIRALSTPKQGSESVPVRPVCYRSVLPVRPCEPVSKGRARPRRWPSSWPLGAERGTYRDRRGREERGRPDDPLRRRSPADHRAAGGPRSPDPPAAVESCESGSSLPVEHADWRQPSP